MGEVEYETEWQAEPQSKSSLGLWTPDMHLASIFHFSTQCTGKELQRINYFFSSFDLGQDDFWESKEGTVVNSMIWENLDFVMDWNFKKQENFAHINWHKSDINHVKYTDAVILW